LPALAPSRESGQHRGTTASFLLPALDPTAGTGEAIIADDPVLAASLTAKHFSPSEEMLFELHTRIRIRSGGDSNAHDQGQ
jgi:hypothetical protein